MSLLRAPSVALLGLLLGLLGCSLGDKSATHDSGVCTPGPDLCDLRDTDCDGNVDEDQPATTVWPDADADGYGDTSAASIAICGTLLGYVPNSEDCDDTDPTVHPTAWDGCDSEDTDCDGDVDEDDPPYELWPDADGDGQGDAEADSRLTCVWSSADATNNLDCDDSDLDVFLGAPEICDSQDNDCDGAVDEDNVCGDARFGTTAHAQQGWSDASGSGHFTPSQPGAQPTQGTRPSRDGTPL